MINNMVKKTRSIRRRDSTGVEKNEDKWNYNGKEKETTGWREGEYKDRGKRISWIA